MDLNKITNWMRSKEGQKSIEEYSNLLISNEEILNSQLERFHAKFQNRFGEFVERVIAKYDTKEYVLRWYDRGIEPPRDLFWFLFEYAIKYGKECNQKEYQEYGNEFTTSLFLVHGYYFLKMDGQGSVVQIKKSDPKNFFEMQSIDENISQLQKITSNFLFIEFYPHTNCDMYKILNEYTKYKEDKIVLHPVSEGFEKSLIEAIKCLTNRKEKFYKGEV